MLTSRNDDKDTKTFSEADDDGKVNEGMCIRILKIGVSSAVKCIIGSLK